MNAEIFLTVNDLEEAAALAAAAGDPFREKALRDIAAALPDRSNDSIVIVDVETGAVLPDGNDAFLRVAAGTAHIWGVRHIIDGEPVLILSGGSYG